MVVELRPGDEARVLRLRWDDDGEQHWVPMAASVREFRLALEG